MNCSYMSCYKKMGNFCAAAGASDAGIGETFACFYCGFRHFLIIDFMGSGKVRKSQEIIHP
jgi:hypothetical protein